MNPDFLFVCYKQYKDDTNKIAAWLAETAGKCGWTVPTDATRKGSTTEDAKAPRLKGRARKLAKEAAAAAAAAAAAGKSSENAAEGTAATMGTAKHIIRIKDFVPMASCIASANPPIRVSKGFLNLIRRCIQGRSGAIDWYAQNAKEGDENATRSTEKHSHFTTILETVLRTLFPLSTATAPDATSPKTTEGKSTGQGDVNDTKAAPLENLFELLTVEEGEPDVDTATEPANVVPAEARPEAGHERPKARYVVEHDDDYLEEEYFFLLRLLFYDLDALRHRLNLIWTAYRDGEMDLTVAAVATNTAIDVVRQAEADFLRDMTVPKNYTQWSKGADLCYLNYIDISASKGFGPKDTERPDELFDYRRYDDVEHCLLVPYLCLRQFDRDLQERNGRIPMMSVEEERRRVTLPQSMLSPRERHDQDGIILMSSVSVIASFVSISNAPSEDEFCVGIRDLVKKQKQSLWLVFAAKCYLDVHHVLMTDVGRGLRELQAAGNAAKATLEEHFRFMKLNRCELRDRNDESECRLMLRTIEDWGCNTQETKFLNKFATRKSGVGWDDHCVVKKHPILAGLLKFSIHLMMQHEGMLLVNSITTVVSIAHVYNAAQQEGYLSKEKPWQDLDYVLMVHSSQDIFVGERPTNTEDYAKRMALAQGISPETFARNRRNAGPKFSKKCYRELSAVCPVASAFRDRYCSRGSVDLSIQVAEDLIHQLQLRRQRVQDVPDKQRLKQWQSRDSTLTLEDFIDCLAEALQDEAPQYQLDYFALHRRTWNMLKGIKEKTQSLLEPHLHDAPKKKFNSDFGIVMLPSLIIGMACDVTKAPSMVHVKRSLHVDLEPLKIAAAEMEKLIDEEGDVELKRLRKMCPGLANSTWYENGDQSGDGQAQCKARQPHRDRPPPAEFGLSSDIVD